MRLLHVVSMLIPVVLGAAEDVVLLTNGQRVRGVIDTSAEVKPGQVAIKTQEGTWRMRADLVAHSEESYATRRAKIADDDVEGLAALARWCLGQKLTSEAAELVDLVLRQPNPPVEARAIKADLADLDGKPDEALPLLRAYRAAGGKDPQRLARLKELEDADLANEQAANGATPPPSRPALADGLEAKGWDAESTQWSNAVRPEIITIADQGGTNQVLQATFTKGDKDKASIKRSVRGISLGENNGLTFWVFNRSQQPLRLSIALKTGNWVFHESMPVLVPAGEEWRQVRFDLTNSTWKCQASDWANTAPVSDLPDLKELQILIYNGGSDGVLLIDGIDFDRTKGM